MQHTSQKSKIAPDSSDFHKNHQKQRYDKGTRWYYLSPGQKVFAYQKDVQILEPHWRGRGRFWISCTGVGAWYWWNSDGRPLIGESRKRDWDWLRRCWSKARRSSRIACSLVISSCSCYRNWSSPCMACRSAANRWDSSSTCRSSCSMLDRFSWSIEASWRSCSARLAGMFEGPT